MSPVLQLLNAGDRLGYFCPMLLPKSHFAISNKDGKHLLYVYTQSNHVCLLGIAIEHKLTDEGYRISNKDAASFASLIKYIALSYIAGRAKYK
jgi:hypothetical protein